MGNILLSIILKSKIITSSDVQNYFNLNDEQLIEILLDFVYEKISADDFYDNKFYSKCLFNIINDIEKIYCHLGYSEKSALPYYNSYLKIKETLYKTCKNKKEIDESLTTSEELMLDIYFYKDYNCIALKLQNNPNMLMDKIENIPILSIFMDYYIENIFTDEYDYLTKVLNIFTNLTIDNSSNLLMLVSYFNDNLAKIKDMKIRNGQKYRLNNFLKKMTEIKNYLAFINQKYKIDYCHYKEHNFDEFILCIDEENTMLREDAFSVHKDKGLIYLTMYISDPTNSLKNTPILEEQAFYNWFIRNSCILFDDHYAQQYFSLDEDKKRDTIAYEFVFDSVYQLKKLEISTQKIKVDRTYSYDEVTEILNRKDSINKNKDLNLLYEVAQSMHEKNKTKKLYHKMKQINYYLNDNPKYKLSENKNGYMIVSELKVFANSILAKMFKENNIPCVYRNNGFTGEKALIDETLNSCNNVIKSDTGGILELLKELKLESYYSDINHGHNGLGLDEYIHITTPARNYFSLLNSKILKDVCLDGQSNKIAFYRDYLNSIVKLQAEKENYRNKVYELKQVKFDR